MVLERELIKQERFYAREITRVFDRAVSALDPTRRVNLTRAIARPAIKAKIQTATLRIFKQGVVSAEDEIKQALKRASAATIDTTLNDFESGIAKIYAEDTTEYMGFLSKEMQDQMNVSLAEGHALGESIPKLSRRLEDTWRLGKVRAVRYARTQTNDVYNAAHMSRYSSSSVVEYVQFSAHLDDRTSPICRMYHKTIWKKDDAGIQVPPLHFSCRSRTIPYFGKVPGERDFKILSDGTEITGKEVRAVDKMLNTFKTKYWKSSGEKALKKAIQAKSKIPTDITTTAGGILRVGRFVNSDSMTAVQRKITARYPTGVSLDGANIAMLKAINEGLERSIGKYNIHLNHVGWQKAGGKTAALYGQAGNIEKGMYTKIQFQKTATKNAIKTTKKSNAVWTSNHKYKLEQIEKSLTDPDISSKYKAILLRDKEKLGYSIRWDVGCGVDNPLVATTIHEGNHAIMMQNSLMKSWKTNLQKEGILTMRDNRIFGVSDYATTNYDELWAEVGAAIELNVKIPSQFKKAYEATIKEVL